MMRGQRSAAVAVRLSSGSILLHEEQLASRVYRSRVARWPFVRGVVLLAEMLVLGTRVLLFAASVAMAGEADGEAPIMSSTGGRGAIIESDATLRTDRRLVYTLLASLAVVIGIFFVLPLLATNASSRWFGTGWQSLVVEGVLRLALLLGYLALIGRLPDIQRVFQYHGAEHKAINAYEAGQPLDVTHVGAASRVHTRCGTGFLLLVMVVSIAVFALLGTPALPLRIVSRIVLVPVIAAIAYELMRLGAANYCYRVVRWLLAPSLALQNLTTREPDDEQMECAIAALERVLERDGVLARDVVV